MESLYNKLQRYNTEGYYPMHMPGHKRNSDILSIINPYEIDITEIDGFDNLHDANDILKDAMERAARLYQSEHTHFLVNGSTVGILSAISGVTNRGDKILVSRNCHKAVYHAIYLNDLNPIYIYPQVDEDFEINGGISPEKLEKLLINNQNIKLVIITSPTYEGIVSDVESISKICHKLNIPLMVDEAHGAHFGFTKMFPKTSILNGADIVIHSVHKTLPSFTQTALLHINGKLVNNESIKKMLSIYESSSPSYILMSSIDLCMELLERDATKLFQEYEEKLSNFYNGLNLSYLKIMNKKNMKCLNIYDIDPSKIVISTKYCPLDGKELYNELLHKYKIQLEMASKDYVIAMTSICDTKQGFDRLKEALLTIDSEIEQSKNQNDEDTREIMNTKTVKKNFVDIALVAKHNIYEAEKKEKEDILLKDSSGRISANYIYLYPPGIPLIVPGEEISTRFIEKLLVYYNCGLDIKGLSGVDKNIISVIKKE